MKVIEQSHDWIAMPTSDDALELLETAGRTCWRSEPKGEPGAFIAKICKRGHESVIEHVSATCKFVTDRSVTHELVRHRVGFSYSQESQRYVRQADGVTFVRPVYWSDGSDAMVAWRAAMLDAERSYLDLLASGCAPQEARAVLPNSTATTIIVTATLRGWRNMLKLRTAKDAHPQIRSLMQGVQKDLAEWLPEVFDGQ